MAYKDPFDPRARASRRAHYYNNKQAYIDRANAAQQKLANEVRALKESNPCTDCGNYYPYYVMQYDHIGNDKRGDISKFVRYGLRAQTMDEIAKCELVCANCHAERTHRRRLEQQETGVVAEKQECPHNLMLF